MTKNGNKFLYLLLIKMLRSIIDYVKYHYQFCENIESSFLSNNLDTNECYIKSCLVYKYLFLNTISEGICLRIML